MHAATQTGRLLHADHDRTADMLNRLEAHLEQAEARGIPDLAEDAGVRALVADLNLLLEEELGHHFDFEEQALFPLVAAGGAYELVTTLSNEHEAMRAVGRRLQRYCALALRDGFDEDGYAAFVHFGWDITEKLERHLQVEETVFLEAVDTLLLAAPEEDARLARAYAGPQAASTSTAAADTTAAPPKARPPA